MNSSHLRTSLSELHNELVTLSSVDEKSRSALATLKDDIEAILDNSQDDLTQYHSSLSNSLTSAVRSFEVSHPTFTTTLNNVISTLNNLGI